MFGSDERSPLWGMLAGGSLIAGGAIAVAQNKSAFAQALKAGSDVSATVSSRVASVPGFATARNMPSAAGVVSDVASSYLQSIPGIKSNMAIQDIQGFAYQSAMAGKAATHEEALGMLRKIGKQASPLEAYEAAVEQLGILGGDVGVLESEIKNVASFNRENILRQASISEGGFGLGFKYDKFDDLSAQAADRLDALKANLEKAWGGGRIDFKIKNITDVVEGQRVTTPMATAVIEGERFNIPLADTGYTYGGSSYSARYATRGGYTATGYKMGYSELSEQVLLDAMSSAKNSSEMRRNLSAAHQTLIDQMNNRDSQARAAAIWMLPEEVSTSGGLARSRLLRHEAVAIGDVTEKEIMSMLGDVVHPYTSPSAAAKGTMATQNLATGLYGDLGIFMSAEERPTQFIRGEWGVTARSKQKAKAFTGTFGQNFSRLDRKIKGKLYDPIVYGNAPIGSRSAYSAPQLMTFYAKPASKDKFGIAYKAEALNELLSAEEGIISKSAAQTMEYERIVQKKITLDEGMRTNKNIIAALTDRPPASGVVRMNISGSQFIGIERGTGKEIVMGADDAIRDVVGVELTAKNEANVFIRERRKLSEKEMWKFFSEENKFMAAAAGDERMKEVLRAAGMGDRMSVAGQTIESVFSGKLVARNQMALLNQQIEATAMFVGAGIDKGIITSPAAQEFLANPTAALNVKDLIAKHGADAHYQIQKNLLGFTRKMGFSGLETQLTFGLTDLKAAARLEQETGFKGFAQLVEESTGVVGLSKLKLGDRAVEGGAGKIGSFEATGFRALAMKGETGERFAAELRNRLLGKGGISESDKMMASVIGEQGFFEKLKAKDLQNLADIDPDELLQAQGRQVSLGRKFKELGGSSSLYIPGIEDASDIIAPTIQKGERVQAPAASSIMSFQSAIKRHAAGKMGDEELEAAAAILRNDLARVSEQQAYAKGKILGSRVLTGTQRSFTKDADVFRISKETAADMFDELLGRAQSEDQIKFLKEQRAQALSGQIVEGGMWRHPTTGPESFQFVKYKVDKDLQAGMIAAPREHGLLDIGGKTRKVDVSSMVGFKGDFDRDHFVLSAISDRDTAARVRKQIGHDTREQYNRYLFNHYSMKDAIEGNMNKAQVLDMRSKEAIETGYRKLTTAKSTTGQVNIALQKLKMGVMSAAPEQYRPMAEMFWHLEEAAIGGKHGILQTELYQAITSSVNKGGEQGIRNMEAVFRSLMGDKRTISGSITDALGNQLAHSYDYDPRRWAEAAIGSLDAVRNDVNVTMRSTSFAKGRTNATLAELAEQFRARTSGSVDVAQSLMQGATGDAATTKATRLLRKGETRARSLLSAVRKGSKPLLAGAAVAAGVMLMAPSTSGVLRKPEGPVGGRNMPPEDLGPPSGQPMSPPSPGPNRSPRVYDIGSGNRTSHANIRMRINDLDSSSRDFMSSARALSDGSGVRINARDDRSILDPRMLASKIHERL